MSEKLAKATEFDPEELPSLDPKNFWRGEGDHLVHGGDWRNARLFFDIQDGPRLLQWSADKGSATRLPQTVHNLPVREFVARRESLSQAVGGDDSHKFGRLARVDKYSRVLQATDELIKVWQAGAQNVPDALMAHRGFVAAVRDRDFAVQIDQLNNVVDVERWYGTEPWIVLQYSGYEDDTSDLYGNAAAKLRGFYLGDLNDNGYPEVELMLEDNQGTVGRLPSLPRGALRVRALHFEQQ